MDVAHSGEDGFSAQNAAGGSDVPGVGTLVVQEIVLPYSSWHSPPDPVPVPLSPVPVEDDAVGLVPVPVGPGAVEFVDAMVPVAEPATPGVTTVVDDDGVVDPAE